MTTIELAISGASRELGLPSELVEKVYKAYWLAVKQAVQALPLKEALTEDQFSELRASFNIPSLGKLHSSYDRVQGVKRRFKYLQQIKDNAKDKKTETDVH